MPVGHILITLAEVGRSAHYRWHHSLAGTTDCVSGDREQSSSVGHSPLPDLRCTGQAASDSRHLDFPPWWAAPLSCEPEQTLRLYVAFDSVSSQQQEKQLRQVSLRRAKGHPTSLLSADRDPQFPLSCLPKELKPPQASSQPGADATKLTRRPHSGNCGSVQSRRQSQLPACYRTLTLQGFRWNRDSAHLQVEHRGLRMANGTQAEPGPLSEAKEPLEQPEHRQDEDRTL